MTEPRWLVDEMLGRLARYLRFLGYDTEYVRGVDDRFVLIQADQEGRRLLTRDRQLAARSRGAILLTRTDIAGQIQELRAAFTPLRVEVRFERCALCNGSLVRLAAVPTETNQADLPAEVVAGQVPLFGCLGCKHLYWAGSHTRSVQARINQWIGSPRAST